MYRSLCSKLGATVAFGLCLAAAPASAAGLLGERYAALGYDYTFVESAAYDDGDGLTLVYNQPLCDTVDIGGSYTHVGYGDADGRDEVGDFSDQRFQLLVTAYEMPQLDRVWVRFGAGVGMVEHGDDDETNFCWSALIGSEYTLGEKTVLHPYLGWSDVLDDSETTTFHYGLQCVFAATEKVGVNLRLEGDHHYNVTLSVGVLARF
ncbi:MAG: hypothetical protein IAE82_16745 [Opitutaceae bacterium]|nr:hypothetical protein [Opitutaceae bacterium]